jgi:enolase
LQLLGDDLFTTRSSRLERGIVEKSANAILIKPNQNGLVSDTLRVLKRAHEAGFKTVVSARSGETEDSWLADLATGWSAQQIKVGSTHGSERTAKWNRLLELEVTEETSFAQPF